MISLQHALKAQYRPGAVWLTNDTTLGVMRQMKDGSGNYYLWQPDPAGAFGGKFLGHTVEVDDNLADLGAGDAACGTADECPDGQHGDEGQCLVRLLLGRSGRGVADLLGSRRRSATERRGRRVVGRCCRSVGEGVLLIRRGRRGRRHGGDRRHADLGRRPVVPGR